MKKIERSEAKQKKKNNEKKILTLLFREQLFFFDPSWTRAPALRLTALALLLFATDV